MRKKNKLRIRDELQARSRSCKGRHNYIPHKQGAENDDQNLY